MKINMEIDPLCNEIEIKIIASEINEEVKEILNNLNRKKDKKHIVGIKNEKIYLLIPNDIFYFYSENRKVFALLENEQYEVKEKLYEIERILNEMSFIRISKSVIANMNKVNSLEMLFNGSMCMNFINNKREFVSRRFVWKIKKYLGIGGK